MRLYDNNCNVPPTLRTITHLSIILYFISASFFFLIYLSLILLGMLYILPFEQNFLGKLTLPILPTILTFYMGMNHLSEKRTLSSSVHKNNNSYRMRVFLSNRRKITITEVKKIVIPTKQIKQETKIIIVAIFIR